jgi:class 3 adenylate cyclase
MPIQDESPTRAGTAGRPRTRSLLFTPIVSFAEAKRVARRAAIVALIFAVMYVIGTVISLLGISPITGQRDPGLAAAHVFILIFNTIALLLILFLAWRISTGRGFVSAGFLFVWFVAEAATKVIGGSAGIGFGLAFFVMALFLGDGVRATWAGSKLAKLPDQAQIGVFE